MPALPRRDFDQQRNHIPAMSIFLTVLLVLAMLGVLGALGVGVATMIRGGNPRLSNKMMQMRVVMQAAALVILALLMLLAAGRS
jgi:Hypoxia induced protein conserved region